MFRRLIQRSKERLQDLALQNSIRKGRVISREAIAWGYRLFLDRAPESRAIVDDKLARIKDTRQLRHEFVHSDEYRLNNPLASASLSGFEPSLQIEEIHDQADLHALLSHIQAAWHHLGETEPHWSVLSEEKFRKSHITGTLQNFYSTGEQDVLRLIRTMERNALDPGAFKSCLEYGCGLGRVTYWLAQRFETITAVDISRPHLNDAERYLASQGVNNVTLRQINTLVDIESLPQVDLIYSVIVLQHNPPPIIAIIVRQFMKSLNAGGVAYFQLPTYLSGYRFSLKDYLEGDATRREMEMHCLPQNRVFEIAHQEGCKIIEVLEDAWIGSRYQVVSNSFLVQKHHRA